jgi:hypothetical protein
MRKTLAAAMVLLTAVSFTAAQNTSGEQVSITKNAELDIGYLDRNIVAQNNGEPRQVTSETVLPRFFDPAISYSSEPDNVEHGIFLKTVSWTDELEQEEQKAHTVHFAYWRALAVAALLGIAGYGVRKHRHYELLRKTVEKDRETARVDINVHNTGKKLEDVEIREFLPSSLEIDEVLTGNPEIADTENGTEIIWSFENLGERDQRVLSYRIRSNEEIKAFFKIPASKISTEGHRITSSKEMEIELEPTK